MTTPAAKSTSGSGAAKDSPGAVYGRRIRSGGAESRTGGRKGPITLRVIDCGWLNGVDGDQECEQLRVKSAV